MIISECVHLFGLLVLGFGNIDMVHAIITDIGIPAAEKGKINDSRIDLLLV